MSKFAQIYIRLIPRIDLYYLVNVIAPFDKLERFSIVKNFLHYCETVWLEASSLLWPFSLARKYWTMVEAAEAGLLNRISCLAPTIGVTKFIIVTDMIGSHFVVLLKSDLDVQQTHLWQRKARQLTMLQCQRALQLHNVLKNRVAQSQITIRSILC